MYATWNDAVSPRALVPIAGLLRLSKLFEVLGCLWDNVCFQLYYNTTKRCPPSIPAQNEVKEHQGVFLRDKARLRSPLRF